MLKGFRTYGIETLKEMYSDQCSPCIGYPDGCTKENMEKAKEWKCQKFCNGLMIVGANIRGKNK